MIGDTFLEKIRRSSSARLGMLSQVFCQHFIGRLETQTDFRNRIGKAIVSLDLFPPILQAVHTQLFVEPPFIFAMLPLDLAIVSWRRYPYPLVLYSRIH